VTPEHGDSPAAPSLWRQLSLEEQREVLSRATTRHLSKDQILFQQEEPAEALVLVESGRLKLTQITVGGEAVTVRFTGPGELCAAIAVLDGKTYPFTAMAAEATRVRLWTGPVLRDLFRGVPRLQINLLEVVGSHTREMLDKFRELATEAVPQRLARAVLRLTRLGGVHGPEGVVIERITQQDLAELTATTLYTVNRILSEWESAGILRTGRGKLIVRSEPRLARIAEEVGP
jgi:CRP-like cAMP-binding protein